jgi:hypothetical protein
VAKVFDFPLPSAARSLQMQAKCSETVDRRQRAESINSSIPQFTFLQIQVKSRETVSAEQ